MKISIKRVFCLLLMTFMVALLISCASNDKTKEPGETTKEPCEHTYEESIASPAMPLKDGVKLFTCSKCQDNYTEAIPMTKSLKILAIGNSFSSDAMEYLWDLCKQGGVETLVTGNLYYGGATLDVQYDCIKKNSASYTYYKNTDGVWNSTKNTKPKNVFADEEWDIITVQQGSGSSGIPSTYSKLGEIIELISEANPTAKIYWHMTWAYQQNSTHNEFPKYDSDQKTMYSKIVNTVKSTVLPFEQICGVVPVGTAIQNLRSSYVGDTITRDGYHLNYYAGRYTAAMTWYAYFTGADVDTMEWVPSTVETKVRKDLDAIKESVKNAIEKPYEATQSTFTER